MKGQREEKGERWVFHIRKCGG